MRNRTKKPTQKERIELECKILKKIMIIFCLTATVFLMITLLCGCSMGRVKHAQEETTVWFVTVAKDIDFDRIKYKDAVIEQYGGKISPELTKMIDSLTDVELIRLYQFMKGLTWNKTQSTHFMTTRLSTEAQGKEYLKTSQYSLSEPTTNMRLQQ